MNRIKVSTQRSFGWIAPGKQSGLTDVVLTVRKPDGTVVTPSPTVTEDINVSGLYTASYTPDVTGVWREEVASASLGVEVVNTIQVYAVDESDLQTDIGGIDTKIDSVEGKVDVIDSEVGVIDGKVDAVDGKVIAVDGKVDTVQSTVDSVKTETDKIQSVKDTSEANASKLTNLDRGYFI